MSGPPPAACAGSVTVQRAPPPDNGIAPRGYGGFWLRVVAYIIDGVIVGIPSAILGGLAGIATVQSDDLGAHNCLGFGAASQQRGWLFRAGKSTRQVRVGGNVDCNDASVLTEWALAGHGLAWRSLWEVGEHLANGALVEVLAEYAAPENGIYAVIAQRKHLPVRVRTWIDFLKFSYSAPGF